MSEIKLLPCPFCGGEAKFITGSPFMWEHAVACGECGTATRMIGGVTPSMARNRVTQVWNTRKPMQDIVKRLEENKLIVEIDDEHIVPESDVDEFFELEVVALSDAIEIVKEVGGIE